MCVFVCVYICVRGFMHQSGNCRCWFVCIQGSACSRTQESFLKAISSSSKVSFKASELCQKLKNKFMSNFTSRKYSQRKGSHCVCFIFCSATILSFSLFFTHNSSFCCSVLLPLTVGLVLSVPAAGGRYTPATGCGVQGETHTTWHVLPATRVRGSCPREKSLVWWRRRSCAESTTTPWWRTSKEQLRAVSGWVNDKIYLKLCFSANLLSD